jgi:hypothetical protein
LSSASHQKGVAKYLLASIPMGACVWLLRPKRTLEALAGDRHRRRHLLGGAGIDRWGVQRIFMED